MFEKFGEAFSLLFKHIWLFSAVVLTVWLPGNVLVAIVTDQAGKDDFMVVFRTIMVIEGVFSPIYVGALLYTLSRIKSGQAVTYREAMAVGVKKWFALFATRFIAGIFIVLGLILLVIPGIILALLFALIDSAVILENKGIFDSLKRSIALTAGRRWEILGAMLLLFLGLIVLSVLVYLPFGVIEALELSVNLTPVQIVVDCAMSVVALVIQIVLFLYYWEAVGGQPGSGASATGEQQVPA